MTEKIVATVIGVCGFSLTVFGLIAKLAAKITTLENKAVTMEKVINEIIKRQGEEMDATRKDLQDHDKIVTVLTTEMANFKEDLKGINTKLDQLITASLCCPSTKSKTRKRSV